jgi:type III secretory pathway component EscR
MSKNYRDYENDQAVQMAATMYPKCAPLWLQYCCKYLDFSVFTSIFDREYTRTWKFCIRSLREKALEKIRGILKSSEISARTVKIKSKDLLLYSEFPKLGELKKTAKDKYEESMRNIMKEDSKISSMYDDLTGILENEPNSIMKYLNEAESKDYQGYLKFHAYDCIPPLSEISRICNEKIGCRTLKGVGRYKYQNLIGLLDRNYVIPIIKSSGKIYGDELKDLGLSVHIERPNFKYEEGEDEMKKIDIITAEFVMNPQYEEVSRKISEIKSSYRSYDDLERIDRRVQSYREVLETLPSHIPVKKQENDWYPLKQSNEFHGVIMSEKSMNSMDLNERILDSALFNMKDLITKKKICAIKPKDYTAMSREVIKKANAVNINEWKKTDKVLQAHKPAFKEWLSKKRQKEIMETEAKVQRQQETNRYLALEIEEAEFMHEKHSELKKEEIELTHEKDRLIEALDERAERAGIANVQKSKARKEREKFIEEVNIDRKNSGLTPFDIKLPPIESLEEWKVMFGSPIANQIVGKDEDEKKFMAKRKKELLSGVNRFTDEGLKLHKGHYSSVQDKIIIPEKIREVVYEGHWLAYVETERVKGRLVRDELLHGSAVFDVKSVGATAEEEGIIKSLDSRIEENRIGLKKLTKKLEEKHRSIKGRKMDKIEYVVPSWRRKEVHDPTRPWMPPVSEDSMQEDRAAVVAVNDAKKLIDSIKGTKLTPFPKSIPKDELIKLIKSISYLDRRETFKIYAPAAYNSTENDPRADFSAIFMLIRAEGKSKNWSMHWKEFVYDKRLFRSCHYRAFKAAVIHELGGKFTHFSTHLQKDFQGVKERRIKDKKSIMQINVGYDEMEPEEIRKEEQAISRGLETEIRLLTPLTGDFDKDYKERVNKKIRLYNAMALAIGKYRYKQGSKMLIEKEVRELNASLLEF